MAARLLALVMAVVVMDLALGDVAQGADTQAPAPNAGTVLITGSDRGIGLALVREFQSRGWRVFATCRDPQKATELNALAQAHPQITVEKLDVSDDAAIEQLAARLKGQPIDVLLNNAGVTGKLELQSRTRLDPDEFTRIMRVNSYAPLKVSAAFLDLVAASRQHKIVGISSGYGSLSSVPRLAETGYPIAYFYAMSKTALNMGLRSFAVENAARAITVMLSPGAVDTDMQRDLRDYMTRLGKPISSPAITVSESAHALVLTIEQLKPEDNGKFLGRDGTELPW